MPVHLQGHDVDRLFQPFAAHHLPGLRQQLLPLGGEDADLQILVSPLS